MRAQEQAELETIFDIGEMIEKSLYCGFLGVI
jgi:hypothetical protein